MANILRVGLIGCGNVVSYGHRPALTTLLDVKLMALADVTSARRKIGQEWFGLSAENLYEDYKAVIAREDVDAVVVTVPQQFRRQIVLDALAAGKHVSRAAGTRPQDWHLVHLFSPRAVVPDSVMPAYPLLFDGAPDRPRQEALDLVAYRVSLGRARELAGPEGEARARESCNCPDDAMGQMAFGGTLNAHPARARRAHEAPSLPLVNDLERGQRLFARHCATCHGATGQGDGVGGATLRPRPAKLSDHDYSTSRLADVLWNGVAGAAMPAWRDQRPEDLAALAQAVRALAVPRQEPALSPEQEESAARLYAANCAQCHGPRGDGNGTAAAELAISPSFRRQRPSVRHALDVLRNGIEDTPMAPWTSRLSEPDMVPRSPS